MKKYIYIVCSLFIATACTRPMTKAVSEETLPKDINNTTLLVEKFQFEDPMIENPYYIDNADSLKKATGITYSAEAREVLEEPRVIENPLIKETNEHLNTYNRKLEGAVKKYDAKAQLVTLDEIKLKAEYNDVQKYRYVLMRKPSVHCYTNPNGIGVFSYRYVHYFHDRLTGEDYPAVEVYSPAPWKTTKAIVEKLNDTEKEDGTTALRQ